MAERVMQQEPRVPLSWFDGYGIELEYMIVNAQSLEIMPLAKQVLDELAEQQASTGNGAELNQDHEGTVELGPIAWSNELAAHVIELKTNGPVKSIPEASRSFPAAVRAMNETLRAHGACLLPSGMHPWMDPNSQFVLYPVDEEGYYGAFDRIFDCRGHGWSNLQSMHINLPFNSDEQLGQLHSAIRLLLPLLPALAASSPFQDGHFTGKLDQRLFVYRNNAARVPSISGYVIPEHITSRSDYESQILHRVYADLSPLDPEGLLQYEWVNARGCIARFDRMALEIRVLDAQECPRADLAIAFAVCEILRQMIQHKDVLTLSAKWNEESLANLLWQVATSGTECVVEDREYLGMWGLQEHKLSAGDLWRHLLDKLEEPASKSPLAKDALWIVEHGCLAQRVQRCVGTAPSKAELLRVYSALRDALNSNTFFAGCG